MALFLSWGQRSSPKGKQIALSWEHIPAVVWRIPVDICSDVHFWWSGCERCWGSYHLSSFQIWGKVNEQGEGFERDESRLCGDWRSEVTSYPKEVHDKDVMGFPRHPTFPSALSEGFALTNFGVRVTHVCQRSRTLQLERSTVSPMRSQTLWSNSSFFSGGIV